MDFRSLYEWGDALTYGAFRATLAIDTDSELLFRGQYQPNRPIPYKHHTGGRPRDLIGTAEGEPYLVSTRVLNTLKDIHCSGWESFAIELRGRLGEVIDGYAGLIITGRCGPIDWSKGVAAFRSPPVPQGRPYMAWVGMYFDPLTWDGADVFTQPKTNFVIVTERIKIGLEKAKLTNMKFTRLTEFERSWPVPRNSSSE